MSSGLRRFAAPGAPATERQPPVPDAPVPDATVLDATVLDATVLDATVSDATVPKPVRQEAAPQDGPGPGQAGTGPESAVTVLEKIRSAREAQTNPGESCEMCATPIPAAHSHVADLEQSSLLCSCRACYLLFERPEAGRGRWRAVPDRYLHDPARPMTAAEWDELEIPVGLAFFLRSSQRDELAGFYPSPAGATECRLDLAAWNRIEQAHPLLGAVEPDVEAALISRTEGSEGTVEHFIVPIDACYELAGRMRMLWKGFDGGTEARASIAEFLGGVRSRARVLPDPAPSETGPS